MPVHVRVLRTHFPHWGAYSGINQFLNYLDPGKYSVDMHVVSDSDEDFPVEHPRIREWVRGVVKKQGMEWYKLSDLAAEMRALQQCCRRKVDILHYLDGEHSALFLPKVLKGVGKFRPKLVATYHQPSDVLGSLVNRKVIAKLDCVSVVSPDQLPFFKDLLPPDKIRLILHGIDTNHFRPAASSQEGGPFICVITGHYLRDFDVVRQVAEKLKAYKDIQFHAVTSKPTGLDNLSNGHHTPETYRRQRAAPPVPALAHPVPTIDSIHSEQLPPGGSCLRAAYYLDIPVVREGVCAGQRSGADQGQ